MRDARRENNFSDITRDAEAITDNSKGRLSIVRYFKFVGRQYHARSLITEISLEGICEE